MEVVSTRDIASDKNNNPISAEVIDKEDVKQPGSQVSLKGANVRPTDFHYIPLVDFAGYRPAADRAKLSFWPGSSSSVSIFLSKANGCSVQDGEDEAVARHVCVGDEYQAVLPAFIPYGQRIPELVEDRCLQCWSPHPHDDDNLEQFLRIAMDKYGYSREQGMAMLFWHNHNIYKALKDLANFASKPTKWNFDDKLRFEQALQIRGKSFKHIQEMMPEKSISSLVEYCYGRTSLKGKNSRGSTPLKKGSVEIGSGEEEIKDNCSDGVKVVVCHMADMELSSNFSDWKIRNALYERHCEKNHSDLKREERSSCPICLKKVLSKEMETYPTGSY